MTKERKNKNRRKRRLRVRQVDGSHGSSPSDFRSEMGYTKRSEVSMIKAKTGGYSAYLSNQIIYRLNDLKKPDNITPFFVVKLAYYYEAWNAVIHNKTNAKFHFFAWKHGPVNNKIYHLFDRDKDDIIDAKNFKYFGNAKKNDDKLLDAVVRVYGSITNDELEEISHADTPYINARNRSYIENGKHVNGPIFLDDIFKFFNSEQMFSIPIVKYPELHNIHVRFFEYYSMSTEGYVMEDVEPIKLNERQQADFEAWLSAGVLDAETINAKNISLSQLGLKGGLSILREVIRRKLLKFLTKPIMISKDEFNLTLSDEQKSVYKEQEQYLEQLLKAA